jgi:glycosyltransferase involved in cell wall biosynthesis
MTRVLALSNIIAPYRVSLFNEVAAYPGISLHVGYLAESEPNRRWRVDKSAIRYPYTILPGFHLSLNHEKTLHFTWGIGALLRRIQPDVLFLGTDLVGSTASWSAWLRCRLKKVPIIRYEARHWNAHNTEGWRDWPYRLMIRRMDRYFIYSRATRDYLTKKYQVPPERIDIGYNVGDSRFFLDTVLRLSADVGVLRERAFLQQVLLLFVGNLTEGKNVCGLLQACRLLDARLKFPIGLLIVGDGPLCSSLKVDAAAYRNVSVRFTGFLQGDALARCFALADIFVLPTRYDAASIALGEALHCGLFAIASSHDGSTDNFVMPGINGYIIEPHDVSSIAEAIYKAVSVVSATPATERKAKIARTMSDFTIEKYAERLVDSIRKSVVT